MALLKRGRGLRVAKVLTSQSTTESVAATGDVQTINGVPVDQIISPNGSLRPSIIQQIFKAFESEARKNLVPDSDIKFGSTYWTLSGLAITAGASPKGGNAFTFTGTGAASGNQSVLSDIIDVTPGQTLTLAGSIDATNCSGTQPFWGIYSTNGATQYQVASATLGKARRTSCKWVVPAGVTQVIVVAATNNTTVANATKVTFSEPQFEVGAQATSYTPNLANDTTGYLKAGAAAIDLSSGIHLNVNQDHVADGATYGRMKNTSLTGNDFDFSKGGVNKILDNIGDGLTYGRPLLARLNIGRPWIDFSEGIHSNKTLTYIADDASFRRTGINYVDGSNRPYQLHRASGGIDVSADMFTQQTEVTNHIGGQNVPTVDFGSKVTARTANLVTYLAGPTVDSLQPEEAGANVTETRRSATTTSLSNHVISDNLLPNGNFTNGFEGWSFPSGWVLTTYNTSLGMTGTGAFITTITTEQIVRGTHLVPIEQNKTYLLEAWVYCSAATATHYMGFAEYDNSENSIQHDSAGEPYGYALISNGSINGYQYFSAEVSGNGGTTPTANQFNEATASIVPVWLANYGAASVGEIGIQLFRISEVAAGARRGLQSTTPGASNYKAYTDFTDNTPGGHVGKTQSNIADDANFRRTSATYVDSSNRPYQLHRATGGIDVSADLLTQQTEVTQHIGGQGVSTIDFLAKVTGRTADRVTYLTGGATVDSLKPAQAGADVTGSNTSADTSKVNGVAAATVQSGAAYGTNLVATGNNGARLGDQFKNIGLNAAGYATALWSGLTLTSAYSSGTAKSNAGMSAATLIVGSNSVSYNSQSTGYIFTPGATEYLGLSDINLAGGTPSMAWSGVKTDFSKSDSYVFLGADVMATVSGGGGGSGQICVAAAMFVHPKLQAKYVQPGYVLDCAEHMQTIGRRKVVANEPGMAACVELLSGDGCALVVTPDTAFEVDAAGTSVLARDMLGQPVLTDIGLSTIVSVTPLKNWQPICRINVGNKSYAAGKRADRRIYSHNSMCP